MEHQERTLLKGERVHCGHLVARGRRAFTDGGWNMERCWDCQCAHVTMQRLYYPEMMDTGKPTVTVMDGFRAWLAGLP